MKTYKPKSMSFVPTMVLMLAILAHSGWQVATNFSPLWLALLLTQLPINGYFLIQNVRHFRDKDPRFRYFTMLALFGVAFALFRLAEAPFETEHQLALGTSLAYFGIFTLVAFWIPSLNRPTDSTKTGVGQRFPSFVLDDEKGNPVSSDDILIQPTLFIFYRGNWCPLCMAQIKGVAGAYQEIADLGVRVVLVSSQPHENTRDLAGQYAVDFTYLVDDQFELADQLDLRHKEGTPKLAAPGYDKDTIYPTVVFTDARGKIVYLNQTDNFRIRPEPVEFIKVIHQHKLQSFLEGKVEERTAELEEEKKKSDGLLLNILPKHTAQELREKGQSQPRHYEKATILFTDFKDFTRIASSLSPQELISELDEYFAGFDDIIGRHNLERIKTIGDAYMAAGGLPVKNHTNPIDAVLAALEMRDLTHRLNGAREREGRPFFGLRVGINTGEVVAGVVGKRRFAFDIWGDAVNLASRMESKCEPGKINISHGTWEEVKYFFTGEFRGELEVKNKGQVGMYFVEALKPRYQDSDGKPNAELLKIHEKIAGGARVTSRKEARAS